MSLRPAQFRWLLDLKINTLANFSDEKGAQKQANHYIKIAEKMVYLKNQKLSELDYKNPWDTTGEGRRYTQFKVILS
jgi:hypothetical protein